ncbi:carbohydrate ABC transporter permease [Phytoactinopolyspora alkaliphila]|uniref:Carbohydrate ABC transporter permease n=1 Tax=Phytoactinopolyspora alkaliphila TaxID=1783498 RepID=A0A6N9YJ50_9ACTN|nr:carbohydrate ABC transporter permease [Phytoactinopolyspora alkaliphila]NED94899.1 carbohydrate ABC transporter permease [Phytoactinopolyspora alkaliphila]
MSATTRQPPKAGRPRSVASPAQRGTKARVAAGIGGRYVLLLVVLAVTVGPFAWQVSTSLKGLGENIFAFPPQLVPDEPTLRNYARVAEAIPLWRYLGNSTIVATAVTLTNCLFGAMAGYALARMRFRGRNALFAAMIATLIIPFEVIMISVFLVTRGLGLINTLAGAMLPLAISVLSIFIMRQAFLALPREVEEAARVDGAGEWQTFWRIGLPSVRGSLAVVAIFSFMFAWDDFLWPLIVLRDPQNFTLTVGLVFLENQFSADQRLVAAGTVISIIPVLALFVFLQRQFFRGVGQAAVKG